MGFIGRVKLASGSGQDHKHYLSDSRASVYCGQTVQRTCKLLMHPNEKYDPCQFSMWVVKCKFK